MVNNYFEHIEKKEKKYSFLKIIIGIIVTAFLVYLIFGIILEIRASYYCRKECVIEKNGIGFEIISNGEFNIHDLCVCYLNNSEIKTWIISGEGRVTKPGPSV